MELERKLKVLQGMYAGALADSVLRLGREGILDRVTEQKRAEQMINGKLRAAQMGITRPQEVFETLSDIFGCANWKIIETDSGFVAEATGCMLCAIAKRMGAPSPCKINCLDPMEGMVKGINSNIIFNVVETLWEGSRCCVELNIT